MPDLVGLTQEFLRLVNNLPPLFAVLPRGLEAVCSVCLPPSSWSSPSLCSCRLTRVRFSFEARRAPRLSSRHHLQHFASLNHRFSSSLKQRARLAPSWGVTSSTTWANSRALDKERRRFLCSISRRRLTPFICQRRTCRAKAWASRHKSQEPWSVQERVHRFLLNHKARLASHFGARKL